MLYNKKVIRGTARVMLFTMIYQLVFPAVTHALTSGPSQPEVQSFEPVGTTDMVDMFTGDFNYNIPLLDIEGYPINIAYHAGPGMDQEASWVGLGWNINPGVINRAVRGLPDDFKGDVLQKEFKMKTEHTLRLEAGFGEEFMGDGDPELIIPSFSSTLVANINNYRGVSADIAIGVGVRLFGAVSAGVNLGMGSQSGGTIDYYGSLSLATPRLISKDLAANMSITQGGGYNTRTGLKDQFRTVALGGRIGGVGVNGPTYTSVIPIGIKNYVPVITNSSYMDTWHLGFKGGGIWSGIYGYALGRGMESFLNYHNDGTRPSYGYLYYQHGTANDIMDFTRDKDGMFNKNMQYLPPGNMTYDVYNVAGQGTGGSFRPFRNDFGTVFDPIITQSGAESSSDYVDVALGGYLQIGYDASNSHTYIFSGPWVNCYRPFVGNISRPANTYESVYFKQGGELTAMDETFWSNIKGTAPLGFSDMQQLPEKREGPRDIRANMVYFNTAKESDYNGILNEKYIYSYTDTNGFSDGSQLARESINRYATGDPYKRKNYHITEFVQTQTDGRRYIYGIPAMNNVQREATYSINEVGMDESTGMIAYDTFDDSMTNEKGIDNYYSSTITPAYAHSYLLTAVLSADYVDVTGDGISDDDIGSYTRFNYTRTSDDYRWRAPIQEDMVQYNRGYLCDNMDDKAFYVAGSREQWMLHSVESKNFVAEFYTSKRNDAKGVMTGIKGTGRYVSLPDTQKQYSYKLDSIKLYNKHDRFRNRANAIPVKTVMFEYSYQLCAEIPNTDSAGYGKLTLKKIFTKYGSSNKSLISPYQFEYNDEVNYDYDYLNKDRWGNYKPGSAQEMDFPYVLQNENTDNYAAAWSLSKITLPSGGIIEVDYESDDYAYVQELPAQEMVKIAGVGVDKYFSSGGELYVNKNIPHLYLYFKKKNSSDAASSYCKVGQELYYNCRVRMKGTRVWEQIKGYAAIEEVGNCGSSYGYIKLKSAPLAGSSGRYNPITIATLNTARYNLPHVMPGFDRTIDGVWGYLEKLGDAMKNGIQELLGKSQMVSLVEQKYAKAIDPEKSYIRLASPDGHKKGGGHRVKTMKFYDSWDEMMGSGTYEATYGKDYSYTLDGGASSGVASYEPLIGGDENPYRSPVKYRVQNGNNWPPLDAIDLYQETPIAESLLPSPVVGYSRVVVTSIHKDVGRSAQAMDIHYYNTAKDFPVIFKSTGIDCREESEYSFKETNNTIEAKQGYTLELNDMHGRPKGSEQYIRRRPPGATKDVLEFVSRRSYTYSLGGEVEVIEPQSGSFVKRKRIMGVDADVTLDSRNKKELTLTSGVNINGGVTNLAISPFPIPILLRYPWEQKATHQFSAAVATKVIQRYGILTGVETNENGVITKVANEVFDPVSGNPIITSVTNEFKDKEYTVNYPAYWAYPAMGAAFANIGFEVNLTGATSSVNARKEFTVQLLNQTSQFFPGDEVLVTHNTTSYVIANVLSATHNTVTLQPKDPSVFGTSTLTNITQLKVLRSGRKNQLQESIQTVTTMAWPFSGNTLIDTFTDVIDIKARTYAESGLVLDSTIADTVYNPYSIGKKGLFRLSGEYAYNAKRKYTTPGRKAGLYDASSRWKVGSTGGWMEPRSSINWKVVREVLKWTPFSTEVENIDAIGNYSTAVYGYNEELPVAVAYNARQGEVFAENFEDYDLLMPQSDLLKLRYSPFRYHFPQGIDTMAPGYYVHRTSIDTNYTISTPDNPAFPVNKTFAISKQAAHTGKHALFVSNETNPKMAINIPVGNPQPGKYNRLRLKPNTDYVLSFWIKPASGGSNVRTHFSVAGGQVSYLTVNRATSRHNFSNIINGWQQADLTFRTGAAATTLVLTLVPGSGGAYYDDIRIFPLNANMKSFVYHPLNEKLMATLDENNYATFYEYDQEGNLIRTKKETEKGIITISESRSANPNTSIW